VNPREEVELIYAPCDGFDAAEDTHHAQALEREVTDALQAEPHREPERSGPYVDDSGKLRISDGRVLDAEGAAETLRKLATTDHTEANRLLDRLEEADPAVAAHIVGKLSDGQGRG
jgi:hypothetical protein